MRKKLSVSDILSAKTAEDDKQGDKVFEEIIKAKEMEEIDEIALDFSGIEFANTAFFNNAIGRLFDLERFNIKETKVVITNLNNSMFPLLQETVKEAKEKYAKPIER